MSLRRLSVCGSIPELLTQDAFLDTRIAYVAETGPKTNRVKRIALMDSDGSNLRYLTSLITVPKLPPNPPEVMVAGDGAGVNDASHLRANRADGNIPARCITITRLCPRV